MTEERMRRRRNEREEETEKESEKGAYGRCNHDRVCSGNGLGDENYVLINAVIPSASMEDTIMTGDRIFGSRLSYEFGEPQRGDIAIFKFPDDESQLYIKRVIGSSGR